MIPWAQLGSLMPTSFGSLGGMIGSFTLFQVYAEPTCRLGTAIVLRYLGKMEFTYACMETPIGSFDLEEFVGFGTVVGGVAGFAIAVMVEAACSLITNVRARLRPAESSALPQERPSG